MKNPTHPIHTKVRTSTTNAWVPTTPMYLHSMHGSLHGFQLPPCTYITCISCVVSIPCMGDLLVLKALSPPPWTYIPCVFLHCLHGSQPPCTYMGHPFAQRVQFLAGPGINLFLLRNNAATCFIKTHESLKKINDYYYYYYSLHSSHGFNSLYGSSHQAQKNLWFLLY